MSVFRRASDLLPGLLPAAFRGVPFHVVNASHEVGRRIVFSYFPGVDARAMEDQGRLDGPITVYGFIIGGDYVAQARALQAAFAAPGPGIYLDPWLGEIPVVVATPAQVKFSVGELRVARIDVIFEPAPAGSPPINATFAQLGEAFGLLSAGAGGLIAAALGARNLPVVALSLASELASAIAAAAIARAGASSAAARLVLPLEDLARDLRRGRGAPAIAVGVARLGSLLEESARRRPAPMVGPGGPAAPRPDPIPPREGARLALAIADDVATLPVVLAADEAVRLAARAEAVGAAARITARIPFESREEALAWRDRIDTALDALGSAASEIAPRAPAGASALWQAVSRSRAALGADLNQVIGRLPRTRRLFPGSIGTLVLAHDLVGDDPTRVEAFARDIIARNRLRFPGRVGEEVEVLL